MACVLWFFFFSRFGSFSWSIHPSLYTLFLKKYFSLWLHDLYSSSSNRHALNQSHTLCCSQLTRLRLAHLVLIAAHNVKAWSSNLINWNTLDWMKFPLYLRPPSKCLGLWIGPMLGQSSVYKKKLCHFNLHNSYEFFSWII